MEGALVAISTEKVFFKCSILVVTQIRSLRNHFSTMIQTIKSVLTRFRATMTANKLEQTRQATRQSLLFVARVGFV